jgi:hypothetical protein
MKDRVPRGGTPKGDEIPIEACIIAVINKIIAAFIVLSQA